MRQRIKAYAGLSITVITLLVLALGLSVFRDYLGIRLSGIPLSQSVVGGALKSDSLSLGNHTLEFRGRTNDGTNLTNQVSFAVQAPEVLPAGPLVLTPSSVIGGGFINVELVMDTPAPAGGRPVVFTISNPDVATYTTNAQTVPAGLSTFNVTLPTKVIRRTTTATITATYDGKTATADFTVRSATEPIDVTVARLKFRVDPGLLTVASEAELRERLVRYVDDVNAVFAKNTVRRFVYDPATDFEVWREPIPTIGCSGPLPERYDFVAYVYYSPSGLTSSNAGASCHTVDGVQEQSIGNLFWRSIWSSADIDNNVPISGTDLTVGREYYHHQINAVIHELGHLHGVAIGEYYNLGTMIDNSGIEPKLDVLAYQGKLSHYWRDHQLVLDDPMFGSGIELSLARWKFSPLSAAIIDRVAKGDVPDSCYHNSWPCLQPPGQDQEVVVEVVDTRNGQPLSGCQVQMFTQDDAFNSVTRPTAEGTTLANGTYSVRWGPSLNNLARLFKVQCNGFQPNGGWLSNFDRQAGLVMPGGGAEGDFRYPGKFTIKMQPR